jgi:sugar-phosphatase
MQVAHGIRTVETMRIVAPQLDVEKEAEAFTAHEVVDTIGVVPLEGAARVLSELPKDAWAIVTSGSLALARARLLHAGLPVPQVLVTAEDVTHGKPAPEPYLVGAQRLGIAVEKCVVIEDAPAGIEAGRKAGMRVIGIQTTHPREMLVETGADVVVERLTRLSFRATAGGWRLAIQVDEGFVEECQ